MRGRGWVTAALLGVACLDATGLSGQDLVRADTSRSNRAVTDTGTIIYQLVPNESDDVKAAIERSIQHMNFIVRPIARHRLTRTNHPPAHLTFANHTDTLVVTFEGANPIVTPRDGSLIPWVSGVSKEVYRVKAVVAGDTLHQTIVASDGHRVDDFIFSEGGARVRLDVRLFAERLPAPLMYSLSFRRVP
ncbi:MAG TPA: hypothetical protein VNW46_15935 [Gemmatimonadaceae bacterium]|nr:hypothetical protein [Gemmatimonadaceae bacterium]